LVYFMVIWYTFPVLVSFRRKIWQPCSWHKKTHLPRLIDLVCRSKFVVNRSIFLPERWKASNPSEWPTSRGSGQGRSIFGREHCRTKTWTSLKRVKKDSRSDQGASRLEGKKENIILVYPIVSVWEHMGREIRSCLSEGWQCFNQPVSRWYSEIIN
jgi:hypothetical protein